MRVMEHNWKACDCKNSQLLTWLVETLGKRTYAEHNSNDRDADKAAIDFEVFNDCFCFAAYLANGTDRKVDLGPIRRSFRFQSCWGQFPDSRLKSFQGYVPHHKPLQNSNFLDHF